jgi:hypothetical protein
MGIGSSHGSVNNNLKFADLQLPLISSTLDRFSFDIIYGTNHCGIFAEFFDKNITLRRTRIFNILNLEYCNTALNRINILKYQHRLN